MIGGYWLLRSLKDVVMTSICGVDTIPRAKMLSVVVVFALVFVYNKALDLVQEHKLFYVFGMLYFVVFTSIAYALTDENIGLPNGLSSPSRLLGWISYCAIESFGSIMVSLFWSFVNSSVSLEASKSCYGLLVAAAQIGSILGPTLVTTHAKDLGIAGCYFCGAICMLLLQVTMFLYVKVYGVVAKIDKKTGKGKGPTKEEGGMMEGLTLFVKHDYVKGIFAISCLFMVEVTIVDYFMKVLAKEHFDALQPCVRGMTCWDEVNDVAKGLSPEGSKDFAHFMGIFGQATNGLSFLFSLVGTSAVLRHCGLRATLVVFPVLCLLVIIVVRLYPTLWVVFSAMMLLKALTYALNNPTKEILYQPTSSAVKYKSKSWIEIFGARGSKAAGSIVTNAFSDSVPDLINNGSLVSICLSGLLVLNARYMGAKFDEYMESGYIVGDETKQQDDEETTTKRVASRETTFLNDGTANREGGGGGGLEMDDEGHVEMRAAEAAAQSEDDTSCGVLEEGQSEDETTGGGKDEDEDEDDKEGARRR